MFFCVSLSAVPYGNHGCQGGNMYNSFLYVVSNDGVDTADSYPFKGKVELATPCIDHSRRNA